MKLSRAAYYRQPKCQAQRDAEVIEALNEVVAKRSRWGIWKCFDRRTFNVIDESNREALGIEVGTSIPGARVIRVLERMIDLYGQPRAIRLDNGPEFIAAGFEEWCQQRNIARLYITPGKPDQNAFIERFNRTFRDGGARPVRVRIR